MIQLTYAVLKELISIIKIHKIWWIKNPHKIMHVHSARCTQMLFQAKNTGAEEGNTQKLCWITLSEPIVCII